MGDICGDNRFEIIAKAKKNLLESTNIHTSEDEMKVLDSFLFRCWQMGWLKRYDKPREPLDIPTMSTDFVKEHGLPCPDGYIFKDENGNVINATKIVLEKVNTLKTQSDNMETETHRGYCTTEEETTNKSKKVAWFTFEDNDFADKVELALSNRKLIQEDGKWFVVKKEKEKGVSEDL